jgi:cysteinyl-tRNA synthetase
VKIYNTMTRGKEEFVPVTPNEARIYVCGVTPYDYSHIGHARSAVVFDVIRRWLEYKGFRVTTVRNYTDVDDKIIRRANQEGVSATEVSQRFIKAEWHDMQALDVMPPTVAPKATEHIAGMVALIERLVAKSIAYVVDGDVYFEIRRFPAYGKLSGKNVDELLAGARVEVDERKRDPRDFALWKATKPGEPFWPSPWGPGRPGWHIECSVMAMRYLGETFDIHGGGTDLIFPHHECEIAQSEADTGKTFARYWLHNGMLNLGAEKMSKSVGNTLAIRELVKRHQSDALRLWMLGTHYRNQLEWSEERVQEAARALDRLWGPIEQAKKYKSSSTFASAATAPLPSELAEFPGRFVTAMDDDFNTPQALSVLFDLVRLLNQGERSVQAFVRGAAELEALAGALGFSGPRRHGLPADLANRVESLIRRRTEARGRRDWKEADTIRAEIEGMGVVIRDTPAGTEWEPK